MDQEMIRRIEVEEYWSKSLLLSSLLLLAQRFRSFGSFLIEMKVIKSLAKSLIYFGLQFLSKLIRHFKVEFL
jgi:hypothetical protein